MTTQHPQTAAEAYAASRGYLVHSVVDDQVYTLDKQHHVMLVHMHDPATGGETKPIAIAHRVTTATGAAAAAATATQSLNPSHHLVCLSHPAQPTAIVGTAHRHRETGELSQVHLHNPELERAQYTVNKKGVLRSMRAQNPKVALAPKPGARFPDARVALREDAGRAARAPARAALAEPNQQVYSAWQTERPRRLARRDKLLESLAPGGPTWTSLVTASINYGRWVVKHDRATNQPAHERHFEADIKAMREGVLAKAWRRSWV